MVNRRVGAFFAGLTLVLAIAFGQAALAAIGDQETVADNTFTSPDCFGSDDTGFLDPTSEVANPGGDGDGFELNPTNAFADGGGNASNVDGAADRHRYFDYGISIPGGCSVAGIEVRIDWWLDSTSGINSMDVELSWNGGSSWTAAKTDSTETTSEHTSTLGSSSDDWGHTWAVSELTNGNFRVRVTSDSDDDFRDFFLDWIAVKVYYAP